MAATVVDNVKINVLSSGTGALTLGTAVQGYRGVEALANGLTYNYAIRNGGAYEIGQGTFLSDGNILSRSVLYSSDGGTPVSLRPGTEVSFVALAADLNGTGLTSEAIAAANQAITASADAQDLLAQIEAIAAPLAGVLTDDGASLVGTLSGLSVEYELAARVKTDDLAAPVDSLSTLAALNPVVSQIRYVTTGAAQDWWQCKAGTAPTDVLNGLYRASDTAGYYWARIWDRQNGRPEWFGAVSGDAGAAAANDVRIAACYSYVPHMRLGPFDYWTTTTLKFAIDHHKVSGCGDHYNDVVGAMSRIVCTSGTADIVRVGPDTYPGSTNALPQGIQVRDIMLGRSVAPVIASNCRGLFMTWVLNAVVENVKTDSSMVGFEASKTVHCYFKKCLAVRAVAGTGAGTDYFVGHYANGVGPWLAGGNASLYVVDCVAGCNYGPLQSAVGSIGFKADQGFTDVWYWNPETTNFYIAQGIYGNDSAGLVFTNVDFAVFHPVHDQFKYCGLYVTDVASAGAVEIENPYYGPTDGARACYWVNSSEGAVASRGGQFAMGGAPTTQAIALSTARGCDVLGFPAIVEHGSTYPVCGAGDIHDARIEIFGKNPTVSAGALIQLTGTCSNVATLPKTSGKNSAFQYGVQIVGTGVSRSTFNVSNINSLNFPATNRQLDNNGTPITAAGSFATTCLAEGNFN